MHELSIALNIIEIVNETAQNNRAVNVHKIEIDIGAISGVEVEVLEVAMQSAIRNTIAENAMIAIHKISPEAICNQCHQSFKPDDFFTVCPRCNSVDIEYIKGKEIKVRSVGIDI